MSGAAALGVLPLVPVIVAGAGYLAWREYQKRAAPPPPAFTNAMCRVRAGQSDHLTLMIQGELGNRGAVLEPNSVWDAQSCTEWWRIAKKPLTGQAVKELLPNWPCDANQIALPECKSPSKLGDLGMPLLIFGAGALAVVYFSRKDKS